MAFSRAALPFWLLVLQSGKESSFPTIPEGGQVQGQRFLCGHPSSARAGALERGAAWDGHGSEALGTSWMLGFSCRKPGSIMNVGQ